MGRGDNSKNFNPFYYSKSSDFFQNDSSEYTTIDGLEISGISGTYRVDCNLQFNTQLQNITAQAVSDLNSIYTTLTGVSTTGSFPAVTTGSTINAGVYYQAGAVAFSGTITFDGGDDDESLFILRTDGAITAAISTTFNLINGASADHIYFVSGGAITIDASVNMSGIFMTSGGAVTTGAGAVINGKLYSKNGAVSNAGTIHNTDYDSHAAHYNMGILEKFSMFSISGAVSNTGSIVSGNVGTNFGTISGFDILGFNGAQFTPGSGASLMTYGIFIDDTILVSSIRETERESSNFLIKREVILNDIVSVDISQTVSIKVINNIGSSKFYNRIITMSRITPTEK